MKIVDRRKRGHALPANMTVSPRGDVSTRAANCRVGALHPPALPDQGSRGGWKPPTLHLIRHSRESGSPDVRENWVPAFAGMTMGSVAVRPATGRCPEWRTRRVGALHPPALPDQGPRGGWKPPTLHLIRHSRESGSPDVRENWIPAFGRVEKPRFRLPDARTGVSAPLRDMNFHNREWGRHSCLPGFSTRPGGKGHEPIRSFVTGTRHDLITK